MNLIEMREQLDEFRKNMEVFHDFQADGAKLMFSYFEKLKEAGFTEAQALEIVKARGWNAS